MKISGINGLYTKVKVDKNKKAKKENVSFSANNMMKNVSKAAILAAGIAHLPLSVMGAYPMPSSTRANNAQSYALVKSADEDINKNIVLDSLLSTEGTNNKIQLRNINLKTMPVSEFYTTSKKKSVTLKPDKDLERNENGAVLYNIKEEKTLNEIIDDVYSDALSNYGKESEKTAVKNKMIDEIIQSNPTLAKNIDREAKSYEELGNKKVTADLAGSKILNIPTAIAYQTYSEEVARTEFYNSSTTYTPSSVIASVVRETEMLLSDEYGSFEELIYGTYGDDISNEAYRDIAYAIVNSPSNAMEFEVVLDDTDFNELAQAGNINDLNRLLKENTSDTMIGLEMPVVTTLSSTAKNASVKGSNKNGVVYQLSPAAINEGDNDRVIEIKSNADGILTAGEVTALKDVVQYYSSPDGRGRFATVKNGETVLNTKVNYVKEFASQIMQQVVYANLDIFTAQYEDKDGVHKYGVFDVNPGYDTKGKTIEEIISNSQINTQRMNNYSFVDENGNSKFEAGTELKLPQFNYRINTSAKLQTVIQEPAVKEEIITPTIAPSGTQDPTTTPTIAPTQEEEPTTAPTPPEGTYVKGLDGNYYKVTSELKEVIKFTTTSGETIIITTEEDDEGFEINGFPVYGKRLPDTDENGSILFQSEDGNWYYVEPESIPSQTEDGFVLVKGEDGTWYYADPSETEEPTTTPTTAPTAVEDPTTTPTTAPTQEETPTTAPTPPEGTYIQGADGNFYEVVDNEQIIDYDGKAYQVYNEYQFGCEKYFDEEGNEYWILPAPERTENGVLTKGQDGNWYYVAENSVPSQTEDGFVLVKGEDGAWYYADPSEIEEPTTTPTTTPTIAPSGTEEPTTTPTTAPSTGTEDPTTTPTTAPSTGTEDPTTSTAPSTGIEEPTTIAPTESEEPSISASTIKGTDGKPYQITSEITVVEYDGVLYEIPDQYKNVDYEIYVDIAGKNEANPVYFIPKGDHMEGRQVRIYPAASSLDDGSILFQGEDGNWYYGKALAEITAPTDIDEPIVGPTNIVSPTEVIGGIEVPTTTPTVAPSGTEDPTTTPTTAPSTGTEEPTTSTAPSTETDEPITIPTTTPTVAPSGTEEPTTSTTIKGTDGHAYQITSEITVVEYNGVLYEIPDLYKNNGYKIYGFLDEIYIEPAGGWIGTRERIYPAASSLDDGSILFQGEDGNWYYGNPLVEITVPTDIDEPIAGPTDIVSPTEVIGGIEVPTTTPTTAPTAVEDPTTTPSTAPSTETDEPTTTPTTAPSTGTDEPITIPTTTPTVAPSGTEDPTTSTAPSTETDEPITTPTTAPSTETDEPITIPTTTPTVAPSGTEVPTTPITVPTTDITFGDIENPTIDGVLSTEEPNPNETIISGGVIIQKTLPTTDGDIGTK